MKFYSLLFALLISITAAFAQKRLIIKIKPMVISKAQFDKHVRVDNMIEKPASNIKHKGTIRIKTSLKTYVFKDDGEMKEYRYEGTIKNNPLILIHELEPNTEEYYVINKLTGRIDTLLDKPVFFSNHKDFICLEGQSTDMQPRIEVGKISDGLVTNTAYYQTKEFMPIGYIVWYNMHTIFFTYNDNAFYKITLKR